MAGRLPVQTTPPPKPGTVVMGYDMESVIKSDFIVLMQTPNSAAKLQTVSRLRNLKRSAICSRRSIALSMSSPPFWILWL
jgi:hypothetical protein